MLALSVDPLEKAKETVQELKLTFPVAYGLELPGDAEKVGAFWGERQGSKIVHATGFILGPERKVLDACYSNGPIGRIVAEDAIRHIRFFKERRR